MSDIYPDRETTKATLSWGVWIILIIVALGAVIGAINFVGGWLSQPAKIYGVENVRAQWEFAYTYDESLGAIQRQYCTAKQAVADSVDAVERSQRNTQMIAVHNNYDRVEAQYNAALRNAFKAKLVWPSDVPEKAPSLNINC